MIEPDDTSTTHQPPTLFKVLIAGGGVAGLEAAFALHELAGERVDVTVLAPASEFVYRPDAVKEPFTRGYAHRYPLAGLVAGAGARLISGALERVDVDRRLAYTTAGAQLGYDALLLAPGTQLGGRYEHVTTVDDARIDELLHGLVQDVEAGYVKRLAFVIPAPMPWPLPAYELALLTSQRAWEMGADLSVTIFTPERAPLIVFGEEASREVAQLLADRRIEVVTTASCEIPKAQTINVSPGGGQREFDRIVALPELHVLTLEGIPQIGGGFIPVDEFCQVSGVRHVYAAGDATDFPVKHGGMAAQQADTAAAAIAALAGSPVLPDTFNPVLEGVLVTGDQPRYFRAQFTGGHGSDEVVGRPVAASTPKIGAMYLSAYLASQAASLDRAVAGQR